MNDRPLISAGTVLGIGMGGFLDGIVLHQILQVHSMLSARYPKTSILNMEINMFWDGLFHAFTWLMVCLGLALLWRAARRPDVPWSDRTFVGAMLLGWGLFNFVEGIIDHYLLDLHHVIQRLGPSGYDLAFLASGVVLSGVGLAMIRSDRRNHRDAE
jgi:uncharacterized membrane protein